jgi:hypothetical protein
MYGDLVKDVIKIAEKTSKGSVRPAFTLSRHPYVSVRISERSIQDSFAFIAVQPRGTRQKQNQPSQRDHRGAKSAKRRQGIKCQIMNIELRILDNPFTCVFLVQYSSFQCIRGGRAEGSETFPDSPSYFNLLLLREWYYRKRARWQKVCFYRTRTL